ncbi:hypothetical protein ACQ4WX_29715 [Streptomyces lasalocidi]
MAAADVVAAGRGDSGAGRGRGQTEAEAQGKDRAAARSTAARPGQPETGDGAKGKEAESGSVVPGAPEEELYDFLPAEDPYPPGWHDDLARTSRWAALHETAARSGTADEIPEVTEPGAADESGAADELDAPAPDPEDVPPPPPTEAP